MIVHLHDYARVPIEGIVDGAVLMHREMAAALRGRRPVRFHDVTEGARALRHVHDGDVIYAGIGPYAHLYHLWRERLGLDVRIVREVHTSFWSGYWTQEELCAALPRHPGDAALFPSEFARALFLRNVAGLERGATAVAYPFLEQLGPQAAPRTPRRGRALRLGYLGALSAAKNFDQVLALFAASYREGVARSLAIAGKHNEPYFAQPAVRDRLVAAGIPERAIVLHGVLSRPLLRAFFASVDVLLFPSTASRETLGRVLLEAAVNGVPALAADAGPAVELLPPSNLIPTALDLDAAFSMDRIVALGRIGEDAAAAMLRDAVAVPAPLAHPEPYRLETLLRILDGDCAESREHGVYDRRITSAAAVERRAKPLERDALLDVEALFAAYFGRHDDELRARFGVRALGDAQVGEILARPARNLADYRAFPRLVDRLAVPPLRFRLAGSTASAPPAEATHVLR